MTYAVTEQAIQKAGWWPARLVKVTDQVYATNGVSIPVTDGNIIAVLGVMNVSSNESNAITTAEVVTGNKLKFSKTVFSTDKLATSEVTAAKTVSYTAVVLIE